MTGTNTQKTAATNPWVVLVSVGLGLIMVVIDISILNIALPTLTQVFHASINSIEWTLIAYTLALTGMVPFFGRVSDVIGRKRLFIAGVLIFDLGSLLASMAPAIGWLIAARLVQAVGGALITTNTLAIITDTFPAGKRGLAMGVQAILVSGGAAIGPTVGGVLVTHLGWQWIFYINIPIGIAAAILAIRVLPPLQSHRTLEPIDWWGGGALLGGMTPLLLAVTKGPVWGWTSPAVLGLALAGILLVVLFVLRELRVRHPLVDLSLFSIRAFSSGQLAGIFATLSMASMMFLLPFYWQALRGFSAEQAGLLMLPLPLVIMITAPTAGKLSDVYGARIVASAGLTITMGALFALSTIRLDMPLWAVLWRLALLGAGLGTFMAPNNNAVMSSVPAQKRGITSGLLGTARYTGQSLGIAFAGTIFAIVMGNANHSGQMPSPAEMAALAHHPAALLLFRHRFIQAMSTIARLAIPLAGIGVLLSLSRGGKAPARKEMKDKTSA